MKTYLITFLLFFSFLKIQAQFVGINTNKPLKTFSVNGTVLVDQNASNFGTLDSASLVFGNVPAKIGIASNKLSTGINYNGLDIWTNNMKRLSITDIGYVGIGIASPATSLHVLSGADVSLNSHGFFLLGNEAGSNMALDNNELQVRNAGAAATLYLQANGGKTQIGHAAESYIQLDGTNIQSTNNQGTNELILNGVNGGKIRLGGNADAGNTKLHISSGVEAGLGAANSGYMMIGASTGDNLIFDNNEILARSNGVASTLFLARDGSKVQLGNGAEAAGTKLHITSGAEVGLNNAESGYLMMGSQTGGNMVLDANEIQARNNGAASNIYMQYSGGNMALGAVTPQSQLHMTGDFTMQSANPTIQMKNAGGTNVGFLQVLNDDVELGTNVGNTTGNLIFRNNGVNRVYINPTGQVSIGLSTPATGYLLSVNGKAMVEELKVQLSQNWPDYVFSNTYKRKSFDELRSYIASNKHLPNIPAASELEKNGLEVGEMQRRMMEKIEELTLYILDLESQMKELRLQTERKN